ARRRWAAPAPLPWKEARVRVVQSSWPFTLSPILPQGEAAVPSLLRDRHQHAAAHALEERFLVRLAPPAREAAAMPMADDDEVGADALGGGGDAIGRVAVLERALGVDAVLLQPRDALVEDRLRALVLAARELRRDALGNRRREIALADREQVGLALHAEGHLRALAQRPAAFHRAVVGEQDLAEHG